MRNKLSYYALVLSWLCLCIAGCTNHLKVTPGDNHPVGEAIARAGVRGESAQDSVKKAIPETSNTGKPLLTRADDDLEKQKADLKEAKEELAKVRTESAQKDAQVIIVNQKLTDEQDHYIGYKGRQSLRFWITTAIVVYVAGGIASVFLGFGGVGSFLVRLLPLMNPFAFIRDKFVHKG